MTKFESLLRLSFEDGNEVVPSIGDPSEIVVFLLVENQNEFSHYLFGIGGLSGIVIVAIRCTSV